MFKVSIGNDEKKIEQAPQDQDTFVERGAADNEIYFNQLSS